jgi:hypothetical protein
MERDRLSYIFAGKDIGLADSRTANHDLVVVVVFFGHLIEVEMAVGEVHDVVEALLAHGSEVFGRFELTFVDDEVEQNFIFVLAHELGLVDGVD